MEIALAALLGVKQGQDVLGVVDMLMRSAYPATSLKLRRSKLRT